MEGCHWPHHLMGGRQRCRAQLGHRDKMALKFLKLQFPNMVWNCAICFASLQPCILLTHLNTRHSMEDLNIVCGIEECRRTFQIANTFVHHVREKHHAFLKNPDTSYTLCEGKFNLPVSVFLP